MISYAFVNSSTEPIYSAEQSNMLVRECHNLCDNLFKDIDAYMEHYDMFTFESDMFESVDNDEMIALEAEGKNIFTKIGEAVMNLFDRFITMMKGWVKKIKNLSFEKKSDSDKLEVMIKQHPELKEKIIANAKDFDFSEIRTLSELDEYYKKILEAENPDKKKELFEKMVKVAQGTGAVVGVGVSVIKIGEFLGSFKKNNNKVLKDAQDKTISLAKDKSSVMAKISKFERDHTAKGKSFNKDSLTDTAKQEYEGLKTELKAITKYMEYNNTCLSRYERKCHGLFKRALKAGNTAADNVK